MSAEVVMLGQRPASEIVPPESPVVVSSVAAVRGPANGSRKRMPNWAPRWEKDWVGEEDGPATEEEANADLAVPRRIVFHTLTLGVRGPVDPDSKSGEETPAQEALRRRTEYSEMSKFVKAAHAELGWLFRNTED